ncbi:MAG: DNA-processing protein DprA [Pseudanabaenaceae cyanobacterium]
MEQAYWLAWYQIAGVGAVTLKRLWQSFGSLSEAWHASIAELARVDGIGGKTLEQIDQTRRSLDPHQFYTEHRQHNPQLWCPIDPDYPPLLWEIPDPPPLLYWQGSLTNWQNLPAVAIVGTRQPTKYGRMWAYRLGKALAEAGFIIVSGLAEGIDAEAHRGCLDTNGKAIAVVGTSLERVYPPQHRALFERISRQGLALSEYPYGTVTDKYSFPRRNRIIAGLTRATLVIEAPAKSGALITAHQANDYGREVYALPNSIEVESARGCLELIAKGANVILGIDELLTALGSLPQLDRPITDPLQQQIYALLPTNSSISVDAIAEASQLPIGQLSALLLEMEIAGLVKNCGGMYYQKL